MIQQRKTKEIILNEHLDRVSTLCQITRQDLGYESYMITERNARAYRLTLKDWAGLPSNPTTVSYYKYQHFLSYLNGIADSCQLKQWYEEEKE